MDPGIALIRLKEAQKRYRERNRDKYNEYMRSYYKKRVEDDAYRQKRNEYRKKAYEKQIRGEKGMQLLLKDVHNNIKGSFQNGKFDIPSVKGKNITTTIDAQLQAYGEALMQGKRGLIMGLIADCGASSPKRTVSSALTTVAAARPLAPPLAPEHS